MATNLHVARRLLIKLIKYHKEAHPVWFPERDDEADPARTNGYWGPWRVLPNKDILQKAKDGVPMPPQAHRRCYGNQNTTIGNGVKKPSHRVTFKRVFAKWNNIEKLSKSIKTNLKKLQSFEKDIGKVTSNIRERNKPAKKETTIVRGRHKNKGNLDFVLPVNSMKHTSTKKFDIPNLEGETGEFESENDGYHVKLHLDARSGVNRAPEQEKDFSVDSKEDLGSGEEYDDVDENIKLENDNSENEYRNDNSRLNQEESILVALNRYLDQTYTK